MHVFSSSQTDIAIISNNYYYYDKTLKRKITFHFHIITFQFKYEFWNILTKKTTTTFWCRISENAGWDTTRRHFGVRFFIWFIISSGVALTQITGENFHMKSLVLIRIQRRPVAPHGETHRHTYSNRFNRHAPTVETLSCLFVRFGPLPTF